MKIKHINGEEIDTDKLPDMEAMAIEKVEEFRIFCTENKVPFLLFIDPKGSAKAADLVSFWNYSNRSKEYKVGDKIDILPMLACINSYVMHLTDGELGLRNLE